MTQPVLGILGGVSPEATRHYYEMINTAVNRIRGGHEYPELVVSSVNFARVKHHVEAGDWAGLGAYVLEHARRLAAAGATWMLVAANTVHRVLPLIHDQLPLPLLHVIAPTGMALASAGVEVAGFMGTLAVTQDPWFATLFREHFGVTVVPSEPAHQVELHAIVIDELCRGSFRPASKERVAAMVARFAERGIDAVILGCTELELLLDQLQLVRKHPTVQDHGAPRPGGRARVRRLRHSRDLHHGASSPRRQDPAMTAAAPIPPWPPERGLDRYEDLLGFSVRTALPVPATWLDVGCRSGRALADHTGGDVRRVGVNDRITAVLDGIEPLLAHLPDDVSALAPLQGQCDLITDIYGAFAYADRPIDVLLCELELLRPGGRLALVLLPAKFAELDFIDRLHTFVEATCGQAMHAAVVTNRADINDKPIQILRIWIDLARPLPARDFLADEARATLGAPTVDGVCWQTADGAERQNRIAHHRR